MNIDRSCTLVLHIGRHKTGSSSIQATLAASRDILIAQGVLFPESFGTNHSSFFVDAFSPAPETHPNNRRDKRDHESIRKSVRRRLDRFSDEFAQHRPSRVVFSAEDASMLPKSGINAMKTVWDDLIAPGRYQIVFYTRDPISWVQSGIQQNVKGNGLTLEDAKMRYLRGAERTYSEIILAYREVFGADAMTVRSFEAASRPPVGLVNDFLSAAGIESAGISPVRHNDGIAAEIILFLSWLYEGPRLSGVPVRVNRKTRVPLSQEDREKLFALKGAQPHFLNAEDIEKLWHKWQSDVLFLDAEYGIKYHNKNEKIIHDRHFFSGEFMEQLYKVAPYLAPDLRDELCHFMDIVEKSKSQLIPE
jgi:hypothetical protein